MNNALKVLDKGEVSYIAHMGDDLMVVNSARVSFAKESIWEEQDGLTFLSLKDAKLIKYLAEHKHWTPFAHPQITLRIKAPISIRTQLFKHKVGFTENEVSRRYVDSIPDVYNPSWRSKPTNGAKQGSEGPASTDISNTAHMTYSLIANQALRAYEDLLNMGIAPEQARFILPQGTYTEWYWTGSLAAYARVYKQRIDSHAQWEVQQYAAAFGKIIAPLFPISWEVLTK